MAHGAAAFAVENRQGQAAGTATVILAQPSGAPAHLASGIIYGFPDNTDGTANTDIPDDLVRGMGLNYCRAGGAQLPDGSLGWVAGQYEGRWLSTLSNYRTTRRYNGRFTLLMHDLWGADSLQGDGFHWPGDNGNWSLYDSFLDRVFSDIKANDATEGLDIDIWNEPDLRNFWGSSQDQYLATWNRTYHRIRQDLPDVRISGPSSSEPATSGSQWWQNYMAYIAQNNVIPDIYSWHLLLTNRNLRESLGQFNVLRQQNNLPQREIVINEYASWEVDEQSPAGGTFYISQLERHNIHGLRANWGSASKLHDLLANLLVKKATTSEYSTTGEWHVYDYYVREMTGQRVATTPSSDELFEVYATRSSTVGSVKVLAAVRPIAGLRTYDITITGLSAVGHTGNRVKVQTRRFDGPSVSTEISGSVDLGIYEHEVVDDKVTFWVRPDVRTNAYAFELVQ
ncbi:glycoside hydrolase superfamily [Plectosphaerella plurivora]|uniref:Glycoside hydrolase superfamily n=1 Tax=Plectosphaerella plurivora TaxID=936078 RepID=A0A9P9AEU9_9PEZI|nr:glycoside hydrolase superfamily [Plectosphaerella plurivora]